MPWAIMVVLGFPPGAGDAGVTAAPAFAGVMTRPVPLTPIDWRYPDEARVNNPRGVIILKCVIDEQGVVDDCQIIRSLPGVTEWAIRKLKETRYRPVTLDGKPIRVAYVFNIALRMNGEPRPAFKPARWRPTPSPELASHCTGPNAVVCRDVALSFLYPDAGTPDFERAGQLLTAACVGGLREACTRLDTSFLPPQLISGVPSRPLVRGPGAEGMVICRVTVEGTARECQGSGGPISDWFVARMLEAKFVPATFEGTPFETDTAVRYSFRAQP
jgi:TonB family protein